jgi:hypothetical protein
MEKRLSCAQLLLDDGAVLNIDRAPELKAVEQLIVNAACELRSLRCTLLAFCRLLFRPYCRDAD